jgi:isopropylmalate/homocitrate/citramalate synthase
MSIEIIECSPRDGLQNLPKSYYPDCRANLIIHLIESGFKHIDAVSFVSPKLVPQMANPEKVLHLVAAHLGSEREKIILSGLVLNNHGLKLALDTDIDEIGLVATTSITFAKRNINTSLEENNHFLKSALKEITKAKRKCRIYFSCAFVSPNDDFTPPLEVVTLAKELLQESSFEIVISDTLGKATTLQVSNLLEKFSEDEISKMSLHFHDTYQRALENIAVGYSLGVRRVDSSLCGLGGCPFASDKNGKAAPGNVATEKIIDKFSLSEAYKVEKARNFINEVILGTKA